VTTPSTPHLDALLARCDAEDPNWVATGGEFGRAKRLPTFRIEKNEKTGMYRVLDETKGNRLVGVYSSIEQAVKANQYSADKRTMPHDVFCKKYRL
jgi:hypothetical protein